MPAERYRYIETKTLLCKRHFDKQSHSSFTHTHTHQSTWKHHVFVTVAVDAATTIASPYYRISFPACCLSLSLFLSLSLSLPTFDFLLQVSCGFTWIVFFFSSSFFGSSLIIVSEHIHIRNLYMHHSRHHMCLLMTTVMVRAQASNGISWAKYAYGECVSGTHSTTVLSQYELRTLLHTIFLKINFCAAAAAFMFDVSLDQSVRLMFSFIHSILYCWDFFFFNRLCLYIKLLFLAAVAAFQSISLAAWWTKTIDRNAMHTQQLKMVNHEERT